MIKVGGVSSVPIAHRSIAGVAVALLFFVCAGAGIAEAGDSAKNKASQQMTWGYKAAKAGYWLEALDRFERANALTPNQPRILNNIAVALEASGRFEEALLAYETGLGVAPNDRVLRRNFSRFREFYDSQVARKPAPKEKVEEAENSSDDDGEDGDSEKGASDDD